MLKNANSFRWICYDLGIGQIDMKSKELIELIQRHDPRGEAEVRIYTMGLVGGIGAAYGRCPTVEQVWRGIDWDSGNLVLRPSIHLKSAEKSNEE